MIELIFRHGEDDLREHLIHYFAENFWDIMREETSKATEVMQSDHDLATSIFKVLGAQEDPTRSKKVIKREGIKLEDITDPAISGSEGSSGLGSSLRTEARREGSVNEGVSQTEEEMIKLALRQSDEQATEEEVARLMQMQSEYFSSNSRSLGGSGGR